MKKSLFFALALVAIGIMPSCKKEPAKNITFGDAKKMTIINYDKIVGLGETFYLDVDKDGKDDLSIQSYYDGPEVVGELQTLYLNCLSENIGLLGEVIEKESYIHYDTIVEVIPDEEPQIVYLSTYNTCEKVDENDVVQAYTEFVPSANHADDTFSTDNYFLSKKVALFRENSSAIGQTYIFDCDNFPINTMTYIGFKLTSNGKSRLGWLKIYLNSMYGNVVNAEIHETAIQE